MTDELARERGLDIEHDLWTRALWDAAHQSFALRSPRRPEESSNTKGAA